MEINDNADENKSAIDICSKRVFNVAPNSPPNGVFSPSVTPLLGKKISKDMMYYYLPIYLIEKNNKANLIQI